MDASLKRAVAAARATNLARHELERAVIDAAMAWYQGWRNRYAGPTPPDYGVDAPLWKACDALARLPKPRKRIDEKPHRAGRKL